MSSEKAIADRIVGILGELIARPSAYPPGDTAAISAYAAGILGKAGYATETIARTPTWDNVVARLGTGQPSLVFNAHADTVGVGAREKWKTDPFKAHVEDGKVFGLGAGNCKGSMAVQLWLAEEIARRSGPKRGEVVFTFVADEEHLGPDGMFMLREQGKVKPTWLVLGAQTENHLITEERGILWAKITTHGRAAHAGKPENGDNAILRMMRVLEAVQKAMGHRLATRVSGDKKSTINIGMLHGGHNTNVVPSLCVAEIDRRLLPSEKVGEAFAELKEIALSLEEPMGSVEVEFLTGTNGFTAPKSGEGVKAFSAAIEAVLGEPARFLNATGVSDGRYFADDGIEIMNLGPGSGAEGHAANESVPIAEMVQSAKIQLMAVEKLLGLKDA